MGQRTERQWQRMTTRQIGLLSRETVIVQPIGAVEQHGPHLPVMTDSFIADEVTKRALARLPESVPCVTLPPLSYGKSVEHTGMPGTIALTTETLLSVCRDIGRSVAASGFRRLVFVNGHGGNPSVLDAVARDIRLETGLLVFPVNLARFGGPAELPDSADRGFAYHAGQGETSIMLALDSTSVVMDSAEIGGRHIEELFPSDGTLSLEGSVPTAWLTSDLSENGVLGDPRGASAAEGESIVEYWVETLVGALGQIQSFEFAAP